MHVSQLSMESSHYGDEGFSDDERVCKKPSVRGMSSDYDKYCYSLPATQPRLQWQNQSGGLDQVLQLQPEKHKEYYASENEAKMRKNTLTRERCRLERVTPLGNQDHSLKETAVEKQAMIDSSSERGKWRPSWAIGNAVTVKARPKGGRRFLCMDLEEVKACRDLGFDLEQDHDCTTLHSSAVAIIPTTTATSRSISSSTNSPITTGPISTPGDDPRDVKARLRVWAQAVALESTSRHS